jgi:hypothetical protein
MGVRLSLGRAWFFERVLQQGGIEAWLVLAARSLVPAMTREGRAAWT